jgi:hypothetical protein
MKPWTKALIFSGISAAIVVAIYIAPSPEDSHSGGENFAYNIMLFIPAMVVSFIFWAFGLDGYLRFLRTRGGASRLRVFSPAILLLPFAVQTVWIVVMVVVVLTMA